MKLNLVYLAAIAFMPFPTALVGLYGDQEAVVVVLYAVTLAFASRDRGAASSGTRSSRAAPPAARRRVGFRNYLFAVARARGDVRALDPASRSSTRASRCCRGCSSSWPKPSSGGSCRRPSRVTSVVVGFVEGDDDVSGMGSSGQVDGSWCAAAHTRRFLGLAGDPDAVGAELGVAQVDADAAGEAARLRPRLGVVAAGHARPRPWPRRARTRRGGCRACRCRAAARPTASAGRRRTGVSARRACTSRATPMAWRWSWFGWRRNITKPSGVSTDSTHATSSARGGRGDSARTKRPER